MIKKAVLFDIDGTLIDSWDFIFGAVKHALQKHGHDISEEVLVSAMGGRSLLDYYKFLLPKADWEEIAKSHSDYQQDKFDLGKPFKGAKKILKKLKSSEFLIGAISNRSRVSLKTTLDRAEFSRFFDIVVSADDVKNPKPHPEHVQAALTYFKVEPNNSFMVGDTQHDIEAGKKAGVKTIGVTYGFLGKDIENHNPDFVIDDLEELLKVLK